MANFIGIRTVERNAAFTKEFMEGKDTVSESAATAQRDIESYFSVCPVIEPAAADESDVRLETSAHP